MCCLFLSTIEQLGETANSEGLVATRMESFAKSNAKWCTCNAATRRRNWSRLLCEESSLKISVRCQGLFKLQVTCEKKAAVLIPPLKQLMLAEPQLERKYMEAFVPLVTT